MTSPPLPLHSCTCKHTCVYAFMCFLSCTQEDVTPPWQGRSRWESSAWGAWNLDFLPWEAPSYKAVLGHYILEYCWDSCHLFVLWTVAYAFHRVFSEALRESGSLMLENSHTGFGTPFLALSLVMFFELFSKEEENKSSQRSSMYKTCIWPSFTAGFLLVAGSWCMPAATLFLHEP